MKTFLAIYTGSEAGMEKWKKLDAEKRKAQEASGIKAWKEWDESHSKVIVDHGAPLGKTKKVSTEGVRDIKNAMTGYVLVRAESHEAAAKLFEKHPHFAIFPGDGVEIMECLPMPGV